jgi:hypothetical protein
LVCRPPDIRDVGWYRRDRGHAKKGLATPDTGLHILTQPWSSITAKPPPKLSPGSGMLPQADSHRQSRLFKKQALTHSYNEVIKRSKSHSKSHLNVYYGCPCRDPSSLSTRLLCSRTANESGILSSKPPVPPLLRLRVRAKSRHTQIHGRLITTEDNCAGPAMMRRLREQSADQ